jgi:hypothetical protein
MSVALVIQHAKRMRHIILSSVACPAVPYFYTLSRIRHDFRENVIEHKMCVLIYFETFFILRRIRQDVIINVHRYSSKVPVIIVGY